MALVYESQFECRILKARYMDVDIRLHPRVTELFDIDYTVLTPSFDVYDMLIVPVRISETIDDPFTASKEDTASFFSTYESKEESYIHSSYSSPDLKAMALVSENLSRPLGKFQSTQALGLGDITFSTSDEYVALSFLDVKSFDSLEVLRRGMSCVVTNNRAIEPAESNEDLVNSFDYTDIIVNGILEGTTLPSNVKDKFSSFYYSVVYFPLSKEYYFRLTSADGSNLQIDDQFVIEDYTEDTLHSVEGSAYIEKGFHLLFVRQQDFKDTDIVELEFKTSEANAYLPFTVDNCLTYGMDMYAVPFLDATIKAEGTEFFYLPAQIEEMSLNSLYLKYYKPITVLARLKSTLLEREMKSLRYLRRPDSISSSGVVLGDIHNVDTPYNLGLPENGITMDTEGLEPTFIRYIYKEAVLVTWFEITEVPYYSTTELDENQSISFCLRVVDEYGVPQDSTQLVKLISVQDSVNVSSVVVESKYKVRVHKASRYVAYTRIAFGDVFNCTELEISDPDTDKDWGLITTLRVYGEVSQLVRLIDSRGVRTKLTVKDVGLTTVNYVDVGFIPAVFNPRYLPQDLRFGGEFLMFCLEVLGDVGNIDILGNTYVHHNKTDYTEYNADIIIQTNMLTMQNKRKFNVYADRAKAASFDWTHIGLQTATGTLVQTLFTTVNIAIENTTGSTLTGHILTCRVPNVGHGYTAVDQTGTVVPVSGVTMIQTLTANAEEWDTNFVKIVANVPVEGATITLTAAATLAEPGTITGSVNDQAYVAVPDLVQTHTAVVRLPQVPAQQAFNMYVLHDSTGSVPNNGIPYDVPTFLTLDRVAVVELSGADQQDIIVDVDVSKLALLYGRCPIVAYDGDTRAAYDTVGINRDNSNTSDFIKWDGDKISVRVPLLKGGLTKVILLRIGHFNGDVTTFTHEITQDTIHVLHFSDSYINSVDGTKPIAKYNTYLWSDIHRNYRKALGCSASENSTVIYTGTIPNIDYSVSFWAAASENDGVEQGIMAAHVDAESKERFLRILPTGELCWTVQSAVDTYDEVTTTGVNMFDNAWKHIVITHETAVGVKIYVNKVLVADAAVGLADQGQVTGTKFILGAADYGEFENYSNYSGALDEFRTYSKVLTQDHVETLFNYYDGVNTDIKVLDMDATAVLTPTNQITTMLDLNSLQGTPVVIYKYLGIDESVIRWIA